MGITISWGKHLLEVCLSYFFQNSEYWNPVGHTEMNCNDLYSCRVTSYFIQGPYGSLLSGGMNGTTCFTPGEGDRTNAVGIGKGLCWRWLVLMNGWMKNSQTPTVINKSHSLCQPSPQGWCSSEHCAFCECRCLVLPFTSSDPLGDSPSWSTAIVLQNARAHSEDALSGNWGLTHCWRIVFYLSRSYETKSDWYGEHFAILQCFLSL